MAYTARSSPRSIASNIWVRCHPVLRLDGDSPRGLELGADLRFGHVLEADETVGDRPHVAAALHVVLAAQRVETGAPTTHVAAEQGEVDDCQHVVDAVVVLGDAECPAQLCRAGGGQAVSELDDGFGRHTGDRAAALQRPVLHRRRVLGVPRRAAIDEVGVGQTRMDDLTGDRVAEGYIGAHVVTKPQVGPLG